MSKGSGIFRRISCCLLFMMIISLAIPYITVNAEADVTPPEVKSISIDKDDVIAGDIIKITGEVEDDLSGVDYAIVYFRNRMNPAGTSKSAYLILNKEGKYEGSINISEYDVPGWWSINFISVRDKARNSKYIYPHDAGYEFLYNIGFTINPAESAIRPLSHEYITKNERWRYEIIDGDLYIGPEAVLTIDGNVIVNGNIYVLGAINNYGNLTVKGGIYAKRFVYGYSTLYNGTVLLRGGANSIPSMVASSQGFDIPFEIYESNEEKELIAYDGVLDITGATLPIIDAYVDDEKVDYKYNGTFDLKLDVSHKRQVTFKLIDVFGSVKNIKYDIIHKSHNPNTVFVEKVSISQNEAELKVGEIINLNANVLPSNVANKNVIWSSSNPSVATVDEEGKVTTFKKGEVDITVTTVDGGYTATCKITVIKPVTEITLEKSELELKEGESINLVAEVKPADATNKELIWSSSDTSVATVDEKGKVTTLKKGEVDIIVTTVDGGYSATCNITVGKPVTGVILDKSGVELKEGESINLVAKVEPTNAVYKDVIWSSNDTSIATVDENGKVTTLSKGEANITVTTVDGGYTATCKITVIKPVTGIYLYKWGIELKEGESFNPKVEVEPFDASNKEIIWESSDTSVATVDKNGKVTALKRENFKFDHWITTVDDNGKLIAYTTDNIFIKATTVDGGYSDTFDITVVIPIKGWYERNYREWYYMGDTGVAQTGWQRVGNQWYYMSSSGAMQTGWQRIGNQWYYMSSSGAMQTGWQRVGNQWYYMSSSGSMQTGWQKVGSRWYYLYSNGAMATNTTIGRYKVGRDGAWIL